MLKRTTTILLVAGLVALGAMAVATPAAAQGNDPPPDICMGTCPFWHTIERLLGDVAIQDICVQEICVGV
jgi:hypothetical protein